MKQLYYILFLIFTLCSCSQNQSDYEIHLKRIYWSNGNLKELKHIDDKGEVYLVEQYDSLGQIRYKAQWANNKGNGNIVFYYSSGKVKEVSYSINNCLNGKYIEYYQSGAIKSIGYYRENKGIGNAEDYDEQGHLIGVYQTYLTKSTSLFGKFDSKGKVLSNYPFIRIKMKNDTIKNGEKAILWIKIFNREMLDSVSLQFNQMIGIPNTRVEDSQDSVAFVIPKYDVGRNLITGEFKSRIKDPYYDTAIVYINVKIYQPFFVKE